MFPHWSHSPREDYSKNSFDQYSRALYLSYMENSIRSWVEQHGDMLFRYALARVGNRSDAEDLVQETFLAAIKSSDFAGRSAASTYLVGILRHKIMDHFRKVYRHREQHTEFNSNDSADTSEGELFSSMFTPKGTWAEPVADWGRTAEHALLDAEFNRILDKCLEKLPDPQRSAFVLRTMEEQSTEDICKNCNVTTTNLGVLLFRARTQLKKCIEGNWFASKAVAQ